MYEILLCYCKHLTLCNSTVNRVGVRVTRQQNLEELDMKILCMELFSLHLLLDCYNTIVTSIIC